MTTEKQREAVVAMLELYKSGGIELDTVMTVIEAIFEVSSSVRYIPYTMPSDSPYRCPDISNPLQPYVTYCEAKGEGGQTNG